MSDDKKHTDERAMPIITDALKDHLFQAIQQSPVSIVITDLNGDVQYTNPMFTKITGYSFEEVQGKNPRILKSGEQPRSFYKELWETILAGQIWRGELHNKKKTGKLFWERATISPIRNSEGDIVSFVAVKEDITSQKNMEKTLQKTNDQLSDALKQVKDQEQQMIQQERLRALGQMASGVSHDFNNSLQPILLAASMLMQDETLLSNYDLAREYINDIFRSAEDASNTVKRLTRFYRPTSHDDRTVIDVSALIYDIIDITRIRWKESAQAHGKSIEVTADVKDACFIRGLESEIRESLINLVFNSVDAIEEQGNIIIRCRKEEEEGEEGWVLIEVHDTGSGMRADTAEKCLEPFYSTKKNKGSGLGLSIVYGIVQRHGGNIEIESKQDVGTCIRLRFPETHQAPETEDPNATAQPEALSNKDGVRILLVDDDALVLNTLSRTLTHMGHLVTTALSGIEGLRIFQDKEFDVVITDQAMPGMTGDQMASAMRGFKPEQPIIMLTGFGDLMIAENSMPDNIDHLLSKPAEAADLARLIKNLTHTV